jgi:hypothetical protein
MQPSTAPTTVTVAVMFAHVSLMMNVFVAVNKSSDLIEAHLISVIIVLGRAYIADTQQS